MKEVWKLRRFFNLSIKIRTITNIYKFYIQKILNIEHENTQVYRLPSISTLKNGFQIVTSLDPVTFRWYPTQRTNVDDKLSGHFSAEMT
jgi:hypothetical protein